MRISITTDLPRTDGARRLRAHLDRNGVSATSFCRRHCLDAVNVGRILRGERTRISVDFALAIEQATGGAVPWYSWASGTREVTRSGPRSARAATTLIGAAR